MKTNRKHNPELTLKARHLRKNMTKEEQKLWYNFLRHYPVRFLRQKVIDDYIVDFYCHRAKLVIELDGSQHYDNQHIFYDKIRTENLKERDLTIIRIPNNEVNNNLSGVCKYIDLCVKKLLSK